MRNYYAPGSWNVICDRCGLKHKANQLRTEWTGLMVCCSCFESRHPQDLIRGVPETSIDWARPEPDEVFVVGPEPIILENTSTPLLPIYPENNPDVPLWTE